MYVTGSYCDPPARPPQGAAGATQASLCAQTCRSKKRGPGQTRRLTGTALGRVIVTGGLIRREANLGPLCYAAVTAGLIHRPAALS